MIDLLLQLTTSAVTVLAMQLLARKDRRGWIVGLANQVLWVTVIWRSQTWGLLVLTFVLIYTYVYALIRWQRDDRALEAAVAACTCRSYHARTGLHADPCPLSDSVDPRALRWPPELDRK